MAKERRKIIRILIIGLTVSLLVCIKECRTGLAEVEYLTRNPYGAGDKKMVLVAQSELGKEEIDFELEELIGEDGEEDEEKGYLPERKEKELTPSEEFREALLSGLTEQEEDTKEQEIFELPKSVDGHSVLWGIKKKKRAPMLAGLTLLIASAVGLLPKIKEDKLRQEHIKRLQKEYPGFAFRFSMLLSAGLTTRQVWERMISVYEKKGSKDVLYEEARITCQEIKNGVSEAKAYENLSRRCKTKELTRFCGLLSQGVRRGSEELAVRIRKEAENALKTLSEQLRRENETVGTRLLFPTMVLLLIVMVIVMLPAFSMI